MSHEALSANLSRKAAAILQQLFTSGDSQSLAVADCLNSIADNGEDSASDAYLVACAKEIRDAANAVITALTPTNTRHQRQRRPTT
jgi:hypothetical protein